MPFLSPPPDILRSASFFPSPRSTYSLPPHPRWHLPHGTSHLGVSRRGSGAVKPAGFAHFPLLGGASPRWQRGESRGLWLHNPSLPLHPEKIVCNAVHSATFLRYLPMTTRRFPFLEGLSSLPCCHFPRSPQGCCSNPSAFAPEHGRYAQGLDPAYNSQPPRWRGAVCSYLTTALKIAPGR